MTGRIQIGLSDLPVDLVPKNREFARCDNPYFYRLVLNAGNAHLYTVADHDAFAFSAGED